MGSIDRIDWHSGGDFPDNLPAVNGGTHIGMYLAWIINNDLIGQMHREDSAEAIQKVLSRQMTGRDFLVTECDEMFWKNDLNEEGIAFTNYYYQGKSTDAFKNYLDDYREALGQDVESLYEIDDTWENYDKLKPLVDKKYSDWKKDIFWRMKKRIGKYTIREDEKKFGISYRYTFSDFTGSILFLIIFSFGLFLMYGYCKIFTIESLYDPGQWVMGLLGLGSFLFAGYFLAAGLYNPRDGVFRVDKLKRTVTIVDFLKSETIPIGNIRTIIYNIESSYRPTTKYAMLCLRLTNGKTVECFIIRSSIAFDIGREIDRDLHTVARKLRDAITKAIRQ